MGSSDSFPAVAPDKEEMILRQIKGLREELVKELGGLKAEVGDHSEQLRELRASQLESKAEQLETKTLRIKLEQVLAEMMDRKATDLTHDARLVMLETKKRADAAVESARSAIVEVKADAKLTKAEMKSDLRGVSRRWSSAASFIGTVIAIAITTGYQQCSAPPERPPPTYQPKK